MRFVKTLTVTAGATEAEPSTTAIRVIQGKITHLEIEFRPGCAWYVYVVIMDRILQIAPANPEQAFCCDDRTMSFTMNYPVNDPPYEFILSGWSPGANYDHKITFRFDIDTSAQDDREALLIAMAQAYKPYG